MAAPSATWTVIDAVNWVAGSLVRKTRVLTDVLQNIHFLGTAHDHSGDAGDGGTLASADPASFWFYTQPDSLDGM